MGTLPQAASHFTIMAGFYGKRSPYANLDGWVRRLHARPAYQRALENGGGSRFAC